MTAPTHDPVLPVASTTTLATASMHPMLAALATVGPSAPLRQRLWTGLTLPLKGLRFLLGNLKLMPFVIIPAMINLILFAITAMLLIGQSGAVAEWIWARPVVEAWYGALLVGLWYVMRFVIIALALVLSYVVVLLVGGIIASPFNDKLSEHTERILTGREPPQSEGSLAWEAAASVGSSAVITAAYFGLLVPVLLLNLIPGVGSVAATVLGAGLSATFLALEYTDSTLGRRRLRLIDKIRFIKRHRASALGFGLGTTFLMWIPVVNLLCMPIAVIAGTTLAVGLHDGEETEP